MLWVESIDSWSNWLISAGRTPETVEYRKYQLGRLADHYVDRSPWELDATDLAAWTSSQRWGRESRRSYRSAIMSFYTWAVTVGHVATNPAAKLPPVKRKRHRPRPTPLHVYSGAADDPEATDQLRLCLTLMRYMGLRCAEVARLHEDDIIGELPDRGADAIRLTHSEELEPLTATLLIHGKGDKAVEMPLHRLVAYELGDELRRRRAGACGTGYRYKAGIAEGWIFPGRGGGHMSAASVGQLVKRALTRWSAHTIRHLFGCAAYEKTGDLGVVQELMRHESPETTRIYTNVPRHLLAAAINTL